LRQQLLRAPAWASFLLTLALGGISEAKEPARGGVSLNLCADQLLLQLLPPERIAALTPLARDPEISARAKEAEAVPFIQASAEEVILLRPDLVISGTYGAPGVNAILRKLGIPVLELAPAESWDEIRAQLIQVGDAVGEPERARALLKTFDARLKELTVPPSSLAVVFGQMGGTLGQKTLGDEVVRAAGFRNLASELGMVGMGTLSIEQVIHAHPQVMLVPNYRGKVPTLARQQLEHPVLKRASLRRLEFPSPLVSCGSVDSVEAVAKLRQQWETRQ
jgi:iron complex transport system substrate-binding protein